jgi:hypothetical protein
MLGAIIGSADPGCTCPAYWACAGGPRRAVREIVRGVKHVIAFAAVLLAGAAVACTSSTAGHPTAAPPSPSAAACRADYCDGFADAGSGWPEHTTSTASATYDSGAYRVTALHLSTVVEPAPVDVTRFAPGGSVRIEVVATPEHFLPPSSLGLACWLGKSGGGFVFLVDDLEATLLAKKGVGYQELVHEDAAGALRVHGPNRLRADCRRGNDAAVRLSLSVNGTTVLAASYGRAPAAGHEVGVVVHGHRAAVRFDDFAVTRL